MPQDNLFCFDLAGSNFNSDDLETTTGPDGGTYTYITGDNPSKSYELKPFDNFSDAGLDFDSEETIQTITFRQEGYNDTMSRIYDLQVYNVSNGIALTAYLIGIQLGCMQRGLNKFDSRGCEYLRLRVSHVSTSRLTNFLPRIIENLQTVSNNSQKERPSHCCVEFRHRH